MADNAQDQKDYQEYQDYLEYQKHLAAQKGPAPTYIDNPSLLQGVPDEQITQEMHPKVGVLERMVAKNLSNDPKATAAYLQKNHPELEVKSQDGQTLLRAPGEEKYKVLDPDNTPITGGAGLMGYIKHPGEALMDLGDGAYDLLSGVGQGAAAGAGAVGGAAGGPAGAVAGGMAAGGASAAGLEAIRQKLGQVAGIPQKMGGSDIVGQGVMGGVLPGLAGAGPVKGLIPGAAKYIGKEVFPAMASAASGVPKTAIKTLQEFYPKIDEFTKSGVMDMVHEAHDKLVDGLAQLKSQAGQKLASAIDAAGPVNIADLKAKLQGAVGQAQNNALELPNEVSHGDVENLKGIYDKLFTHEAAQTGGGEEEAIAREEIPDDIKANALFRLQDAFRDEASLQKMGAGPKSRLAGMGTSGEKKAAETMRGLYDDTNAKLDQATGGLSQQYKDQYRDYSNIQKTLQPYFSTPEKTFATLGNLNSNAKRPIFEMLQNLEQKHDIPVFEEARLLEAFKHFGNPAALTQSGLGTTSTSRSVPAAIIGGSLGSLIGYKMGGGYTGAALGGILGSKAGQYMGSPAMVKRAVRFQGALGNVADKIPTEPARDLLYGTGRSVWDAVSQNQKAKAEENKP